MVELALTNEQFQALHELVEGKAKSVRVDVQVLTNILIDHSRLVRALRERGIRVTEGPPPETHHAPRRGRQKADLG